MDTVLDYQLITDNKINNNVKFKHFMLFGNEASNIINMNHTDLITVYIQSLENMLNTYKYDDILYIITEYKEDCLKKEYLLYILALCCSIRIRTNECKDFREDCFKITLDICKHSYDLFTFVDLYEKIHKKKYNSTGWHSSMKTMISKWYNNKTIYELISEITNNNVYNNWSHKDIIKLAHVKIKDNDKNKLIKYIVQDFKSIDKNLFTYLYAYQHLKYIKTENEVIQYILDYNFTRDQIPSYWLNNHSIWRTLLNNMSTITLLKNLNKMTLIGLFYNNPDIINIVLHKLNESNDINPFQYLITLKLYKLLNKQMIPTILNTLDNLLQKSIINNNYNLYQKKILIGVDISYNMLNTTVNGIKYLSCIELSCLLSIIFTYINKNTNIIKITDTFSDVNLDIINSFNVNLQKLIYPPIINNVSNKDVGDSNVSDSNVSDVNYDYIIIMTNKDITHDSIKLFINSFHSKNTKFIIIHPGSNYEMNYEMNYLTIYGCNENIMDIINRKLIEN